MKHLPVNWREGTFLLPQHFQAADRFWSENTRSSQQWDHPYHYGLGDFRHDFEGNTLRIKKLRARMRDGTLVLVEEDEPALTIDLEPWLQKQEKLTIYLCVPEMKLGEANVQREDELNPVRFISQSRNLADENESGGEEKPVEFRDLNACLKSEGEDRAGFSDLPIARVRHPIGGSEVGPQLDTEFIPPVLSIDAWTQLHQLVRDVRALLSQEIDVQAAALHNINLRDHGLDVLHSARFSLLDRLNEAAAVLGVVIPPARGVHPFDVYAELCRIVGKLAIYTHKKRLPAEPDFDVVYDHEHLGEKFIRIHRLIDTILKSIEFNDYLKENFVWQDDVMVAQLTPAWFDESVEWYVGVERGKNVSPDECRRMLSRDNNFLWKFGSLDRDIYDWQATALELRPVEDPNRAALEKSTGGPTAGSRLPSWQNWTYWRVNTDPLDPNFRSVSQSFTVAVYMDDRKNRSFRKEDYAGTSRFPVIPKRNETQPVELHLALFGKRD